MPLPLVPIVEPGRPMTVAQSRQGREVMERLNAALASDLARLELLAAKFVTERRGGVLQFPWRQERNRQRASS
jgi:hypothetical protein